MDCDIEFELLFLLFINFLIVVLLAVFDQGGQSKWTK